MTRAPRPAAAAVRAAAARGAIALAAALVTLPSGAAAGAADDRGGGAPRAGGISLVTGGGHVDAAARIMATLSEMGFTSVRPSTIGDGSGSGRRVSLILDADGARAADVRALLEEGVPFGIAVRPGIHASHPNLASAIRRAANLDRVEVGPELSGRIAEMSIDLAEFTTSRGRQPEIALARTPPARAITAAAAEAGVDAVHTDVPGVVPYDPDGITVPSFRVSDVKRVDGGAQTLARLSPMPVTSVLPDGVTVKAGSTPVAGFTLPENGPARGAVRCFGPGGDRVTTNVIAGRRVEIRPSAPAAGKRLVVTCTAPAPGGRFMLRSFAWLAVP